jgi:hypothetical protein
MSNFSFKDKSLAKFLVPDWVYIVDSGTGLSYRPTRLHRLGGRYNPMPESTNRHYIPCQRLRIWPLDRGLLQNNLTAVDRSRIQINNICINIRLIKQFLFRLGMKRMRRRRQTEVLRENSKPPLKRGDFFYRSFSGTVLGVCEKCYLILYSYK